MVRDMGVDDTAPGMTDTTLRDQCIQQASLAWEDIASFTASVAQGAALAILALVHLLPKAGFALVAAGSALARQLPLAVVGIIRLLSVLVEMVIAVAIPFGPFVSTLSFYHVLPEEAMAWFDELEVLANTGNPGWAIAIPVAACFLKCGHISAQLLWIKIGTGKSIHKQVFSWSFPTTLFITLFLETTVGLCHFRGDVSIYANMRFPVFCGNIFLAVIFGGIHTFARIEERPPIFGAMGPTSTLSWVYDGDKQD